MRNSFLQKSRKKWSRETSSIILFVFLKKLYMRYTGQHLSFNTFLKTSASTSNENKWYKYFGCWSRDMLDFDFLEKSLGLVSLLHFVHDFSRQALLILYSINWPNFIFRLSLFTSWDIYVLQLLVSWFVTS